MKTPALLLGLTLLLVGCSRDAGPAARSHDEGPHGGRWLEGGDLALEVTIFERGVPPEFRLYAFHAGEPVAPADIEVTLELLRFGGRVDRFAFKAQEDYLLGDAVVEEPHSFDVTVRARYEGESREWSYESHEGRTTIAAEMAERAGVTIAVAGPGRLHDQLTLHGRVEASPERRLHVTPRFSGVIRSVTRNLGDDVKAGETLATVESNQSMQVYSVVAPISGVLTERKANPGESAGEQPLFEITDFSSVVAELTVFPGDHTQLRRGQVVRVRASTARAEGEGEISSITPVHQTVVPTWVARVPLQNQDERWSPGLFVIADVTIRETEVPVSIPLDALQVFRGWDVVFLNARDTYQAQPVEVGRRDGKNAEVLSGLEPGDRYVLTNSYLIKADIEKSGASHDH